MRGGENVMANSVPLTICGNLTQELEGERNGLRYTATGTAVLRFTVAVNQRRLNKDKNEWEDGETSFYPCSVFGDLAVHVAESLGKGTRVIVSGSWSQQHWEENGEKKSRWQLLVDELGPSLRYATAVVQKMARSRYDAAPPDDEWSTASTTRPEPAGAAY